MKIVAINGSYRRGGITDQVVDQVLSGAREKSAETEQIFLSEQEIAYCRNCRRCMQAPGEARGRCVLVDAMSGLLERIEAADAVVMASPVNFGTVTAVMKCFIERLACYGYWPWGAAAPQHRIRRARKPSVLITSSAMPGWMARMFTSALSVLRLASRAMGFRVVGSLVVGLAASAPDARLSEGTRRRARKLGRRLVS